MALLDPVTLIPIWSSGGVEIAVLAAWRLGAARHGRRQPREDAWEAAGRSDLLRSHVGGMAIAGVPFLGPFIEWFISGGRRLELLVLGQPHPTFGQASLRALLPLILSISAWAAVYPGRYRGLAPLLQVARRRAGRCALVVPGRPRSHEDETESTRHVGRAEMRGLWNARARVRARRYAVSRMWSATLGHALSGLWGACSRDRAALVRRWRVFRKRGERGSGAGSTWPVPRALQGMRSGGGCDHRFVLQGRCRPRTAARVRAKAWRR
jgi:hypothetical protein